MSTSADSPRVRLSSIMIPPEHGSWGFLLEPILLGLGTAPSLAGLGLSLGVIGVFLARHPLKMAVNDRLKGRRYARTRLAERAAACYILLAFVGWVVAVVLAGFAPLLFLLPGIPLTLVLFAGYAVGQGRALIPELSGASALALAAPGLAAAGGKSPEMALALWAILLARSIPSILYVRARLRLERDKPFSFPLVLGTHLAGVVGVILLAVVSQAPVLTGLALAILLLRAVYGLSPYRGKVRVQTIGLLEMGYGLLVVVLSVVGYAMSW